MWLNQVAAEIKKSTAYHLQCNRTEMIFLKNRVGPPILLHEPVSPGQGQRKGLNGLGPRVAWGESERAEGFVPPNECHPAPVLPATSAGTTSWLCKLTLQEVRLGPSTPEAILELLRVRVLRSLPGLHSSWSWEPTQRRLHFGCPTQNHRTPNKTHAGLGNLPCGWEERKT